MKNETYGVVEIDAKGFRVIEVGTGANITQEIVNKATVRAPTDVAPRQKKPSRKITTTPGLIKPVNSWMNWIA